MATRTQVWTTTYSGNNPVQDTDPITTDQPTLENVIDKTDASHWNTLRDKVDAVARQVGDKDDNPAGSLRARASTIENDITVIENSITTIENNITNIQTDLDIQNLTEKVSPVNADLVLIEDSEDSYNKKKVQISNISGGGGVEPLWEWNGTDLTQFDALLTATNILSSNVSVISEYGLNWVDIEIQGWSAFFTYHQSVLPITAVLPDDVRITADVLANEEGGANRTYAGFAFRIDSSSPGSYPAECYFCAYNSDSTSYLGSMTTVVTPNEEIYRTNTGNQTYPWYMPLSGSVKGQSLLQFEALTTIGIANTNARLSSGTKHGLFFKMDTGSSNPTWSVKFRNIKVWAI